MLQWHYIYVCLQLCTLLVVHLQWTFLVRSLWPYLVHLQQWALLTGGKLNHLV